MILQQYFQGNCDQMNQKQLGLYNQQMILVPKSYMLSHQFCDGTQSGVMSSSMGKILHRYQNTKIKNIANQNVSQCSTTFEEDLSKMSPKKLMGQLKKNYHFPTCKNPETKEVYKIQNKNSPNIDLLSCHAFKTQPIPKISLQSLNFNQQAKGKKRLLESRKGSTSSNFEFQLLKKEAKRGKISSQLVSSKSQQRFHPTRKYDHLSPTRFDPVCQTETALLKKSKHFENQNGQEKNGKNIKYGKQTVSTSSSNKSTRQLKISDFEIGKDLGKGKFGLVKIARHKKTGMVFSIKIINKKMIKQDKIIDQLIKEIKIQSFLNHSHIVKLYSIFDDKENVYLLMELCAEGNLYQYMQKKGKIPEEEASQFMKQTCEAVSQLHFNKIIHRDIKPQNIVLCFGMVKICDFGWSTEIKGQMRETFCGSPLYISPQLLKGQLYDEKVDLWALGILGYQMLTGTIPFNITNEKDLAKIIHQKIIYPNWMSEVAIQFLKQLLDKNPNGRTNVQELLCHPFLNLQC